VSDIQKVREIREKDSGDWEDWPYPTETIESRVTGELRESILRHLNRADDGAEVLLIESKVSSGYSEYTQEDECEIEVKIAGKVAWGDDNWGSSEGAMAAFLRTFTGQ